MPKGEEGIKDIDSPLHFATLLFDYKLAQVLTKKNRGMAPVFANTQKIKISFLS